jgi:hypothetical protein
MTEPEDAQLLRGVRGDGSRELWEMLRGKSADEPTDEPYTWGMVLGSGGRLKSTTDGSRDTWDMTSGGRGGVMISELLRPGVNNAEVRWGDKWGL